ncbi:hypothetical protein UFOVP45_75 [uncultured Caudovirales phage]|uniref:Deoxynucleoside monophosphate kinase n=1 Tax=uncultured Caudovirales phage TaxID=2100421 RepID=A0A6J5KSD3_9CAUD|nr:hypothetical protein UFOVP45_75 [uncultured Caudovirales phage]
MIIGLSGYARSGKDTVANHLVEKHGFVKLAFADPMREALVRLDPLITINGGSTMHLSQGLSSLSWEDLKAISPDIRSLLQRMGTEVGRAMFGQNVWVDMAMTKAADYENVVFSDVRFLNEAEAVRTAGGSLWRIERPGGQPANGHVSEVGLDDYPFNAVVNNDLTIEAMLEGIDQGLAIEQLMRGNL